MSTVHDVIIIGSGPAGYTAAIYAARANLRPVLLAGLLTAGGELMKTTEVENYPGFHEGIMGPDLMERMEAQASRFGAKVIFEDVESMEITGEVKKVTADGSTYLARTVIVATGSAYRKLGVPGEDRLSGAGVSYCATCDGSFFTGQDVLVVGGGDSAMEEALFMTKFAKTVTLLVRGTRLKASKVMADRAAAHPGITIRFDAELLEVNGDSKVTSASARIGNAITDIPAGGVFVAIGNDPCTHLVKGQLALDPVVGTILVDGRTSRTSVPGVFAAGDVTDPSYRQAITAAASGCVAAQDVEHYLSSVPAPVLAAA